MAEWASLPKDLVESIADRLETPTDLLRLRSVCATWRASAPPKRRRSSGIFRILPNDGISSASFGFHLSKRTVFLVNPPPDRQGIVGGGWVVKIEEDVPQRKRLLNPLCRHLLDTLPSSFPRVVDLMGLRVRELGHEYVLHHVNYKPNSLGDSRNLYMEKVVMVWSESERERKRENLFFLLTIHVSGKLAIFKGGDRRWSIIRDMPSPYDDVIVYKGRFFAVDNTGRTVVVGLDSELVLAANSVFGGDKKYLVESQGELLLVDMYLSIDTAEEDNVGIGEEFLEHLAQYMSERTIKFRVFRLEEGSQSWIEMRSLGDRVLFLGDDCTFSASAEDLCSGCAGDCILFVDNFFYAREEQGELVEEGVLAGSGIGVFELRTGNIGPLKNYPHYAKLFWPPPQWVTLTSEELAPQLGSLTIG